MSRWGRMPVSKRHNDALAQVSPQDFERLVAKYFRRQGYEVEHSGTAGTGGRFDGGIDLKLRRPDEYVVVQCKRENVFQVTHNPVHELIGVMATQKATAAIFVNTGEYTRAAKDAAAAEPRLRLIDGEEARAMLTPLLEMEGAAVTSSVASVSESAAVSWERIGNSQRNPRSGRRQSRKRESIGERIVALGFGLVFLLMIVKCAPGFVSKAPVQSTKHEHRVERRLSDADRRDGSQDPVSAVQRDQAPSLQTKAAKEESEERRRKGEEAMEIIAGNTPEIQSLPVATHISETGVAPEGAPATELPTAPPASTAFPRRDWRRVPPPTTEATQSPSSRN